MTSVIDRIESALDMASVIIAEVTPEQLAAPSLCAGWDVRAELNHLVGGMRIFAAELCRTDAGAHHDDDWLGDDYKGAFGTAEALDRTAWRRPDALDSNLRLSFGAVPAPMAALIHLSEIVIHGADLAVVTGQEHHIDQCLCEQLLADMREMDFDAFRRPGMFGAEMPAPDTAAAHRRLLAFVGRRGIVEMS
jgi:uncharacterized protein (TIGR03086 family)